ncbi:MAG TPA: hypothetical protein VIN59_02660 [Alphaproteobacteria bacterium]
MNKFFKALSVVSILTLAACASPSTTPAPVDMSFSQMAPVGLNVAAVQVLNASAPSPTMKGMALTNTSPATALETYATRRLQAEGTQGTLNFTIQQATMRSREVAPDAGNWTDNMHLGKPTEHTVTMKVGLNLSGIPGITSMKSGYTLERKKTIPAGASLAQRDYEINTLIKSMVQDMDAAVMKGLSENMHIVAGPVPMTYGNAMPMNDAANQVPVMINNAH